MALVLADRVRETTSTTGTGTVTLAGAAAGYQSFASVGDGNTTYYCISAQSGTEWEVGIGTYTSSGTTLSRDTILASSNSGSAVDFSAGTKDVFVTYPSERGVYVNGTAVVIPNSATIANNQLTNSTISGIALGSNLNSATFNNLGSGDASGTTYNGSTARTISYNTVGAPSTTGTNASGTWGISISGTAASATNLAGGGAGQVPYNTGSGATSFLAAGTSGYVLKSNGTSAPSWTAATISGVQLGSNLSTLTLGSYLTGTSYNGSGAVTAAVDATTTNTASKVVARDASGNFAAGVITVDELTIDTPGGTASFLENNEVSSWIYTNISKSVTGDETAPTGLFFKPDGTKVYISGDTGNDITEYTLGTAWDVSTAASPVVFSVSTEDTSPQDVSFSSDGLTMFVLGAANDTVYQYTLSVAWDLSTASYASKSFSVTSQETAPTGMAFKTDGTVMYIVGTTSDTVFQYTLGTVWDVSTASYASISKSVSTQDTTPNGLDFRSDGLTLYMVGATNDRIYQYTLSSAWDVSTATYIDAFYVGNQEQTPNGLYVSIANEVAYIVGSSSDTIFQYDTNVNSVKTDSLNFVFPNRLTAQNDLYVQDRLAVGGTFQAYGSTTLSTTSVSGTLTASGAVTFSTTTGAINLGTSQTTGAFTIGGTAQTGAMTIGRSTGNQTINIGTGATASGSTKTINIGTSSAAGSTTNISIGSTSGTSTTTLNSTLKLGSGSLVEFKSAIAASAIDLNGGNYFSKTISGATTFTISNTAASGNVSAFVLDLTNGGSATVTWWSGVKWAAGTAPTLTASGRDLLAFFTHDGGTTWNGLVLALDIK